MGTSKSVDQFSSRIIKVGTATERANREIVTRGALLAKEIIIAEASARGIRPSSKIAGGKWGVGFDVKGTRNATAIVKVRGPFHLADGPTKAHEIGPRKKGRRRSGKQAVSFGQGEVYRTVMHPGTKGKGSFPAAKAKAQLAVPRLMAHRTSEVWRQALK